MFITFEGGEGAGKSTQIRLLAERLRAAGVEVVATREPGGSPGAEQIRDLVINGPPDRWSARTEALLMYAARSDHIERTIAPSLDRGAWVLCDRFADSTRVYQAAEEDLVDLLEARVLGEVRPDLTLILDLPVETGLGRAARRGGGEDRFETKGPSYHEALRQAFVAIAKSDPVRCRLIDATGDVDTVAERIWRIIAAEFGWRL